MVGTRLHLPANQRHSCGRSVTQPGSRLLLAPGASRFLIRSLTRGSADEVGEAVAASVGGSAIGDAAADSASKSSRMSASFPSVCCEICPSACSEIGLAVPSLSSRSRSAAAAESSSSAFSDSSAKGYHLGLLRGVGFLGRTIRRVMELLRLFCYCGLHCSNFLVGLAC